MEQDNQITENLQDQINQIRESLDNKADNSDIDRLQQSIDTKSDKDHEHEEFVTHEELNDEIDNLAEAVEEEFYIDEQAPVDEIENPHHESPPTEETEEHSDIGKNPVEEKEEKKRHRGMLW